VAENLARRPEWKQRSESVVVGDVMVALGDSIAAGIGAGHVSEGCMWLLADRLRARNPHLEFHHLAVPSESSASMLQPGGQLDRAERVVAEAAEERRRVGPITLSIGGNDIMEAALIGDEAAIEQLERNLETILRRLDSALRHGGARIHEVCAVQTVYNPFEALPPDQADLMAPRRASRRGFNAAIRRVAQNMGVRTIDVDVVFRGRAMELTWVRTGDIHPTGAGHELIADLYMQACGWSDAG
jgi:lysophospholipase L1-like esterase